MNYVEPIRKKEDVKAVEDYLASINARDRLIFVFGINTGLRISDILALNIEDVKDKNYVEVREKKTGKYKRFPLNSKLKELILKYLQNYRSRVYTIEKQEPLFVGKKHKRMNRSQVYRFLNAACKQCGITANIGTHTMRKTFGYHHYKQFNDVALLQKILNHSSGAITMRYIGIDQEEIDFSYSKFIL